MRAAYREVTDVLGALLQLRDCSVGQTVAHENLSDWGWCPEAAGL